MNKTDTYGIFKTADRSQALTIFIHLWNNGEAEVTEKQTLHEHLNVVCILQIALQNLT